MSIDSEQVAVQIQRWVDAGLITPEQAQQITQFEGFGASAEGSGAVSLGTPLAMPPPVVLSERPHEGSPPQLDSQTSRSTLAVEVVAYLGAALIVSAVVGILARQWEQLLLGGRLALIGFPTVIGVAVGWVFRTRTGPLSRLASVLWFVSLGGVAAFVALMMSDGFDVSDDTSLLVVLSVVVPLAAVAWWLHSQALQLVALIGTSSGLIAAAMQQFGVDSPAIFGFVMIPIGLAWFAQSRKPYLEPGPIGMAGGLFVAFIGTQAISGEWPIAGSAVLVGGAIALMALSVMDRSTPELLLGALGLFISLPRLVSEWLGGSIGAPIALLLCGLVLVGVAVRVAHTRGDSPAHHI